MRNKEQEILEAAEREFIAKGFAGARTTSIAEAAGVTHAMLHYYFRTKEQLFERILDEKMRLMGESAKDGLCRLFLFLGVETTFSAKNMPEWRIAPKSDVQNRSKKNDCFTFLGDDDTSHLSNITKR